MWCFFDESWMQHATRDQYRVGVFAGILTEEGFLDHLDRMLFAVRQKYYGREHARDYTRELHGTKLLSNNAFRLEQKTGFSTNLSIVREVLAYLLQREEYYLRVFASVVYGRDPKLLCPEPRRIPHPYKIIIQNVSEAVRDFDEKRRAITIYDQRVKTQNGIAVAVKSFIQGRDIPNLHPVPYFGVSHASPALQVSDLITHIIAKRWAGQKHVFPFYEQVKNLQWTKKVNTSTTYYGINTWYEDHDGRYQKK
jgi:hypothetical protein